MHNELLALAYSQEMDQLMMANNVKRRSQGPQHTWKTK
jgi:hypothetical protein